MKPPAGWILQQVEEFVEALDAGVSVNAEDNPATPNEFGVLKVSAVSGGRFFPAENKRILPHEISRANLRPKLGCILVSRSNTLALVGESALVTREHQNLFLPDKLWQITFRKNSRVETVWFSKLLQSSRVRSQLLRLATGSSGSMKNISKEAFLSLEVLTPPLPEQRKIADILGSWDEAVEKLDALIAAKERRNQALMRQLLTSRRRLPNYRSKWAFVQLKDVAKESLQRNGTKLERSRLYAVTKAEGMVPMRAQVQGATIDRCKIVERGWFAYNPMRINIGSIARWEERSPVMVSPDYVVFHTDESKLLSDYLNHLRRSAHWSSFVGGAGNGSVRVRIWFDDLGHLKLHLPPITEQRAITDVLDTADKELRLLRAKREAIEKQRSGLMQKLLTGKIRIKPRFI